jgi:hypothetical protein
MPRVSHDCMHACMHTYIHTYIHTKCNTILQVLKRSGDERGAKFWFLKSLEKDCADKRALRGYVELCDMKDMDDASDVDDLFKRARAATKGRVAVSWHAWCIYSASKCTDMHISML